MPQNKKLTERDLDQARETGVIDAAFGYEKANPYDRQDPRWHEYEQGYSDQKKAKKFERKIFNRS